MPDRIQALVDQDRRDEAVTLFLTEQGAVPAELVGACTDAHHVTPWADGGKTSARRCVLLCRHHHMLVHEGDWGIDLDPDSGRVTVTGPGGPPYPVGHTRSRPWNGQTAQAAQGSCVNALGNIDPLYLINGPLTCPTAGGSTPYGGVVRFQVSQVMDAIEQHLTTDVTGAQAVVDLGEVVRRVELDRGRPVNLVRIGMVIDAFGRYLVDGGAMLYGVAGRDLLSEAALTSKERMVLGRWTDEGLIEVTPTVGDRVVEIADLTGLPVIALRPYPELVARFGWLADGSGRVLRLTYRSGIAVLSPMDDSATDPGTPAPAIGRARIPASDPPTEPEPAATGDAASDDQAEQTPPAAEAEAPASAEVAAGDGDAVEQDAVEQDAVEQDAVEQDAVEGDAGAEDAVPLPIAVFADRGAVRVTRTHVSWRRFMRAEPDRSHVALLREWRCDGFECPAFGEHRRIGQPVPRMRGDVPVCPRHDQPVVDVGPRQPAYAVSIVVDDLPRRRLVVRGGHPVQVGRASGEDAASSGSLSKLGNPDDADVVSLGQWLHQAAAGWISPVHLRLEAGDEGLVVTDLSDNGTVVWQRKGPDDLGTARSLHRDAYVLGEWDSVELYTGVELARGDRRLAAVLGREEPVSVLLDAPTAAHHQVTAG